MRAKQVCRAVLTSRTARLLYGSYNVRKFRHLPRHLAAAELTAQLNDQVLLNYSWLYHKCRACSFDELLSDFTLAGQQTEDRRLVLAALRAARPHVGVEAASLAAELAGRLLSFVGAGWPDWRRLRPGRGRAVRARAQLPVPCDVRRTAKRHDRRRRSADVVRSRGSGSPTDARQGRRQSHHTGAGVH